MMINFDFDKGVFNLRAAGLSIKDNKVLLVYYPNMGGIWSLPGGRCDFDEDTKTAVIREYKEETGVDIKVLDKHYFAENFFTVKGKKYHEILITHEVQIPEDSDLYKQDDFIGQEGEKELKFKWIEIAKLSDYTIKPNFLVELIKDPAKNAYIINRD